jgi:hypothetical protein
MMPPNQESHPNGILAKSNPRNVGIAIARYHSRRNQRHHDNDNDKNNDDNDNDNDKYNDNDTLLLNRQSSTQQQQQQHHHPLPSRQQTQTLQPTEPPNPTRIPTSTATDIITTNTNIYTTKYPRQRSCWSDFTLGLTIYLLCILLPTFYKVISHILQSLGVALFQSCFGWWVGRRGEAAWTDLGVILVLSLTLAMGRIWLVQRLVNIASPQHVEAMLRCKSLHLLSSAYSQSLTPKTTTKVCKLVTATTTTTTPSTRNHHCTLQSLDDNDDYDVVDDNQNNSSTPLPTIPNLWDPSLDLSTQSLSHIPNSELSNDFSMSPIIPRILSQGMMYYSPHHLKEEEREEDLIPHEGKFRMETRSTLSKSPSWVER